MGSRYYSAWAGGCHRLQDRYFPLLFYKRICDVYDMFRAGCSATEQQHVLFVDASSIYTKGRAQNSVSVEQADQIYALYQARTDVPGLVCRVAMDEIIANDHNLNIARYVQRQQDETGISVPEVLAALQAKLAVQEEKEARVAELLRREKLT